MTAMQRTSYSLWAALWAMATFLGAQSLPSTAAVLRCRLPDGGISYQDSSCPNGARGEPVDATPNQGFRFASKQEIDRVMRAPPEERPPRVRTSRAKVRQVFNADERRFIRTGMHTAEVRRRIGPPDQIAHSSADSTKRRNRDSRQQWIYLPAADDPQTTTTLTVKGGLVLHVERKVTR